MTDGKQGFFRHEFGQPASSRHGVSFRAEWDDLARRVYPSTEAQAHGITHFFQFAQNLDQWIRGWGVVADRDNDAQLRSLIGQAQLSLTTLLQEARSAFEQQRLQRVNLQQQEDQIRWAQESARQAREAEHSERLRRQAEHEQRLRQTHQEIAQIYSDIAAQRRRSADYQGALWRQSMFPDTTCACGRSKLSNHGVCWECANRGRGY